MASKSGRAGASTRGMVERRALIRAGFGILVLGVGWIFFAILPRAHGAGIGAMLVLLVVFKVVMGSLESKIHTKKREEKRAIRGAKAEEKIEDILDQLGDDHYALHDVSSDSGNIDHVVLSKNHGVFLIETKAHGGRVTMVEGKIQVNGKPPEKDFISQTARNTHWLVDQLRTITGTTVWVNSLIVFTNAFVERSRPVKGITVINKKFLLSHIQHTTKTLPDAVWEARGEIANRLTAASTR